MLEATWSRPLTPHVDHTTGATSTGLAVALIVGPTRCAFSAMVGVFIAGARVNAGSLELECGRPDAARRLVAIALTVDVTSRAARQGLASARARQ